jgi:hypothetical protein
VPENPIRSRYDSSFIGFNSRAIGRCVGRALQVGKY